MRTVVLTAALMATAAVAAVASAQPQAPRRFAPAGGNELTLYEMPNFQGRQQTYNSASNDVRRQGFTARSARTGGAVWSLCDGTSARDNCSAIRGSVPNLSFNVVAVRPGEQSITLFEQPNFGGRQFTYNGASDEVYRQGFATRSARINGGGSWTLCEQSRSPRCQVLSGDVRVLGMGSSLASVEPGSSGRPLGGGSWAGRDDRDDRWGDRDDRRDDRWDDRRDDRNDRWDDRADRNDRWDDRGPGGGWSNQGDVRRVRYDCSGGLSLRATFDNEDDTVELRFGGETPVVLEQTRTASGFRYLARGREFYGRGRDATYVIGRRAPIQCRERS